MQTRMDGSPPRRTTRRAVCPGKWCVASEFLRITYAKQAPSRENAQDRDACVSARPRAADDTQEG